MALDHGESLVDGVLVGGSHFDVSAFGVDFVDRHGGSAPFFLDALDDFSARADHSADKFFGEWSW